MKKVLLGIVIAFLMVGSVYADPISSGVTTGAAGVSIVYNGPCLLIGASCISNTATDCQMWLLDSGVTKYGVRVDASVKPSERDAVNIPFNTNLQLWHVGAGCEMIMEYIPK